MVTNCREKILAARQDNCGDAATTPESSDRDRAGGVGEDTQGQGSDMPAWKMDLMSRRKRKQH